MKLKINWTSTTLWIVYLSLLAVLLPHTAWAFSQFESDGRFSPFVAWAAAFTFEAAIATLTHKLARHIEQVPNYKNRWRRFTGRYVNAYSFGLLTAVFVSTTANIMHAAAFAGALYSSPLFIGAFGGILPLASLVFARVLSNVTETEQVANPELVKANETIRDLRSALRKANKETESAERRFAAAGDIMRIVSDEKRERILAIHEVWPQLPQRAIATMADTSPSYVSETLSANGATK